MTPAMQKILWDILKAEAKRLGEKAMEDQPDIGKWFGKFQLFPHESKTGVFNFVNDPDDPLRFAHESGFQFRPLDPFVTDLGSIPKIIQKYAPRKYLRLKADDFKEAFIQHDSACSFQRVWVRKGDDGEWKQMPCPPVQADVLLFWGLSAPTLDNPPRSATRLECQAIYRSVRMWHTTLGKSK